jgi:hypothetical protein
LLTEHLKPGHLTYMQIEAEYPTVLGAFVTYVMIREAWQQAGEVNEQCKAACDGPRDDAKIETWQGAQHVAITLNTGVGETYRFLCDQLGRAGAEGSKDVWIQTKMRALELEAEGASGDRAA